MDIPAEALHMEVGKITGSLTVPSHFPRRLPNDVPKNQKLSLNGMPNWMPNHMTRGLPNAYRDGHRRFDQEHTEPIIRTTFTEMRPPRSYQIPDEEMPESGYAKRLSESRSALLSRWVWPLTVKAYVLDMDQWYTALANAIGGFYHPQMVTSESNMRTDSYDNTKNESSHLCPKSRQVAVAIDIEIERTGTPHTTLS